MLEKVSVIIPAYNSSQYIAETINSVLSQTYSNLEIIVVDDGSTDNTLEIVNNFNNAGVKIFTQSNIGACAARNLGFHHSKGEFIQFLDADDVLAPDKIELQMKQLLTYVDYSEIIIHCKWGRFYKNVNESIRWEPHEDIQRDLQPAEWLIADRMSMTGCWLTPRALIQKGGLWDESLRRNQDGEFFSRLLSHAQKVLYCSAAKVYYRSGIPTSVSANQSQPAAESALKAIDLIKNYTLALEDTQRSRLSMANKYLDFAFAYYTMFPDLAFNAEIKVKELGGATLRLEGSYILRKLDLLFGWKTALKIKNFLAFYRTLLKRPKTKRY